jgi:hypothetical protein
MPLDAGFCATMAPPREPGRHAATDITKILAQVKRDVFE